MVSAGDSGSDIDGDLDQAFSQLLQARPAPLRPDQEALLLLLKTSLAISRIYRQDDIGINDCATRKS